MGTVKGDDEYTSIPVKVRTAKRLEKNRDRRRWDQYINDLLNELESLGVKKF